jgi:hypothetical protein
LLSALSLGPWVFWAFPFFLLPKEIFLDSPALLVFDFAMWFILIERIEILQDLQEAFSGEHDISHLFVWSLLS